jgi:chemotaxis protein MotB
MFDTSSSELKPYTRVILREIGKVLNSVPSKLSLSGHTDAALFGGGEKGYSNWELSSNRANSSRREMIAGGMDENKVLRVVGLASTVLFDKNDPLSSINRRISIVVLNKRTEEAMLREDDKESPLEVGADGLNPAALPQGSPPGDKR